MAAIFLNDWQYYLKDEFEKPYYIELKKNLVQEYKNYTVYPDMYDIFNALHFTSLADTKVVIIGQDPYHNENQAHGLSFSVQKGVDIPPSLKNIYKELYADLGIPPASHGCLIKWAEQGVMLLNAVLTVRAHQAASHKFLGWENFTDRIIEIVNAKDSPVAFVLWGAFAQSKQILITNPNHLIIKSSHPSPLSASAGFFGSKPFSTVNDFLISTNQAPIDWTL